MYLIRRIQTRISLGRENWRDDRDFSLLLMMGFFSGISTGINTSVFNNFLNDTYQLTATGRGIVEIPRELPGLLIVLVLALLAFLGDVKIAMVGMVCYAVGMFGLGLLAPNFETMILFMMIMSLGMHIIMPLAPSIGMALSKREEYGMRLGRYNSYCLLGRIFLASFHLYGGVSHRGLFRRLRGLRPFQDEKDAGAP